MNIPILVICYNNHKYVQNTLEQIKKINPIYYNNIIIMNNCSTDQETLDYLKSVDVAIINRPSNCYPRISFHENVDLYNSLPDKFILTDPDLEFNSKLPSNFIEILSELSDAIRCYKIGFALDISDFDKMFPGPYTYGKTIYEWESQFWKHKIENKFFEMYAVEMNGIDTTFALVNKKNLFNPSIRIAGDFTAKHLPWYIENKIYSYKENYEYYKSQTEISSSKQMIMNYYASKESKEV